MIRFFWDDAKAERNKRDHGINFEQAREVFYDPFAMTFEDSVVETEQRLHTIGLVQNLTIVLVVHLEEVWGGDIFVRIISARKANPTERIEYEQNRRTYS